MNDDAVILSNTFKLFHSNSAGVLSSLVCPLVF